MMCSSLTYCSVLLFLPVSIFWRDSQATAKRCKSVGLVRLALSTRPENPVCSIRSVAPRVCVRTGRCGVRRCL